jgi:4-diphosphocytidyl-2C-methyl-D-erythritol kinase
LANFPVALNGRPGRVTKLVALLQKSDLAAAGREFYNSLEAPALHKYPVLVLYQEFLRSHGAAAALMSGSGSTTFALFNPGADVPGVVERFKATFGATAWTAIVPA